MEEMGTTCRDVRTREVGITEMHKKIRPQDVELTATLRKIFFFESRLDFGVSKFEQKRFFILSQLDFFLKNS